MYSIRARRLVGQCKTRFSPPTIEVTVPTAANVLGSVYLLQLQFPTRKTSWFYNKVRSLFTSLLTSENTPLFLTECQTQSGLLSEGEIA